jgi:hypothetical protein
VNSTISGPSPATSNTVDAALARFHRNNVANVAELAEAALVALDNRDTEGARKLLLEILWPLRISAERNANPLGARTRE